MKIDYQEPSKDLLMRIDIHEKYGSANIDVWTNELLKPQAGMNILDVGCGAGEVCVELATLVGAAPEALPPVPSAAPSAPPGPDSWQSLSTSPAAPRSETGPLRTRAPTPRPGCPA